MPLLEVRDLRDADTSGAGPLLAFHLEMPRPGFRVDGADIETWGWVVGRDHPAISVEFACNGRVLRRVPVCVSRPDVASHHQHAAWSERSGFRTELPIAGRAAEFRIDVSCTLSNGTRAAVGVLTIGRRWREKPATKAIPALVSIVIPCFNQAHYIRDAIASARAQTHAPLEIVVVDDGSMDNVAEVVATCANVRYVRQEHSGLAAARNTGIRRTLGSYLIFLDADDRLLPHAVAQGLASLDEHPESALTSGRCRWIASDGSPIDTPDHGCPAGDHFANLLRSNYTGMPATVMYRRSVFEAVAGFDAAFRGAEDYELLLRIARQFPVCCHSNVVAEYRVGRGSMSGDPALMLQSTLRAVRAQRPYLGNSSEHARAYEAGLAFWQHHYGRRLRHQIQGDAQRRQWRRVLEGAWTLARWSPRVLFGADMP